jgi:hypothetical protein
MCDVYVEMMAEALNEIKLITFALPWESVTGWPLME